MESAALYLRLSKEDADRTTDTHSHSIENQRLLLEAYAAAHHYTIAHTYIDDDYSGLYYTRPAFTQMLADAAGHRFSIILSKTQSRLSRNMEHAEYLLHDLFPSLGIRFIGVVDGTDSAQKYNKKARQINALVNEWYSEDLSESIRAVYQRKMQAGEYLGAYAPYGYRKSDTDHHMLVIEETTAAIVRDIYAWYLDGASVSAIRDRFEQRHIPTPLSHRIHQTDCRWSTSTIKKILANATYTGCVVQGKSHRKSFKDKTLQYLPQDQWITIENCHEPIISKETYHQATALRHSRQRRKPTNQA